MSIRYNDLQGPKGSFFFGNLFQFSLATLHQYLEQHAHTYGDVFKIRMGPGRFTVVSSPEIVQQILKARPYSFRRMRKMDRILRQEGVHGLFNAEGDDWKVHRRIVNKGLNLKHQKQYFASILKSVDRLYRKMNHAAQNNQPYAVQEDLKRFTVDVTTSLAFGFEMNTLEQKGGVIQEHMEKIFPMIFKRINAPLPLYRIFKTQDDREYDRAFKEIEKQVEVYIESGKQRLQEEPDRREQPRDILEALLAASEEEKAISNKEIKGNLLTLLLAGEDTTAHSLAWALFWFCQYPEVQSKLQNEADELLGNDKYLKSYDAHDVLSYTSAVIHETLRLKSVAPLLLLEPIEDIEMSGYFFEKGAKMILLTRYGALHEDYFSESKAFLPDRWMEKTESRCPVHNLTAIMPFGAGPRMCPGKHLALLEMKLVLSMIARNFNVELITSPDSIQENLAFTMMPDTFTLKLTPRKEPLNHPSNPQ